MCFRTWTTQHKQQNNILDIIPLVIVRFNIPLETQVMSEVIFTANHTNETKRNEAEACLGIFYAIWPGNELGIFLFGPDLQLQGPIQSRIRHSDVNKTLFVKT